MCLGDSNEVPGDSVIQTTLESYGGRVLAQGIPTRWEGNREIDWVASDFPSQVSSPFCPDLHFSDHKVVQCSVDIKAREGITGNLLGSASWRKPQGLTTAQWRDALEKAWEELSPETPCEECSCQQQWDEFMLLLDQLFRRSLGSVIHEIPSESERHACQQQVWHGRAKAQPPKWTQRPWVRRGPLSSDANMAIRKARRRLARMYELLRWCNHPAQTRTQTSSAARALSRSLGYQGQLDREHLKQVLPALILEVKTAVHAQVRSSRQTKLKNWKDNLLHEPGALGQWLRKREAPQVSRLKNQQQIADSPTTGAAMVASFWTKFWEERQQTCPGCSGPLRNRSHGPRGY